MNSLHRASHALVALVCAALCSWASGGALAAAPRLATAAAHAGGAGDAKPPFVPGEVLVKLRPTTNSAAAPGLRAQMATRVLGRFRSGAEQWELKPELDTAQAIAALRANPAVLYAEPNWILSVVTTPNDPRYTELYGLHNTGQNGGTAGADISAETAWDLTTGSSAVLVGVIDTGVDMTHPDLADNIWTNPNEIPGNGIDDDGNGFVDDVHGWDFVNNDNDPSDDYGHGTHTAGTIGAVGNNGIGVAGVAWNVKIVPIKFLDSSGSGTTANAVRAVEYATSIGVALTSNSWGGGGYSQALYDAIADAGRADILFIAAAGNASLDNDVYLNYPSSYDLGNVIAVAATDRYDALAWFSSYGRQTVDLGAPGVDILSTVPGGGYGYKSGTSMATPHVAGVAALIRAAAPGIDSASLKTHLLDSVDPIPALAAITVSGGRLNAARAVSGPDAVPPAAIDDLTVEGVDIQQISLRWTATGDDGATGTASSYDLRYATSPITEQTFSSAARAVGIPHPSAGGTVEHFTLHGLLANTTYYLAIEARDDWGNGGPLGANAIGTTLPGVPDFRLLGDEIDVSSMQSYTTSGASTVHDLSTGGPRHGEATLHVRIDGDYGDPGEYATVTAEGAEVGTVGPVGQDCAGMDVAFPVSDESLSSWTADGVVHLTVQNSFYVDAFCTTNAHTVRLAYRSDAGRLDYGGLFLGLASEKNLVVQNAGTDVLVLDAITSDNGDFVPSASSLVVSAGGSIPLTVRYLPSAEGPATGVLTIHSNDPDTPVRTVDLAGSGILPPVLEYTPPSFGETLLSGATVTRTLTITNTGHADLVFQLDIHATQRAVTGGPTPPIGGALPPGGAARSRAPVPPQLTAKPGAPGGVPAPPPAPPAGAAYAAGQAPLRAPVSPGDDAARDRVRSSDLPSDMRILIVHAGDPSEIRYALLAFPEIAAVDLFNAYSATPTLDDLSRYRVVVVAPDYAFRDSETFGNVLADYVDAGGGVVLTTPAFVAGWQVRGRFAREGYGPFTLGSGPNGSSTLGDFDAGHPIMDGVSAITGSILAATTLETQAVSVATWANGFPFVATRGARVAGINIFVGVGGYWTGDVPRLLRNAAFWANPPVRWLKASQAGGTLPAGASTDVTLTFDATDVDGGAYDAEIRLATNDPKAPDVGIPVHLDVIGAPDIDVTGQRVRLTSTANFTSYGASTTHHFDLAIPPQGGATFGLEVTGYFAYSDQIATLVADGSTLGQVGGNGTYCGSTSGSFAVGPDAFAAMASDGGIDVTVTNSAYVGAFCTTNQHAVTLNYAGPTDHVDFGALFIGLERRISIQVANRGTQTLDVSAITSDSSSFRAEPSSFSLPPRRSRTVQLVFSPLFAEALSGTLSISSNDTDEAVVSIGVLGRGLVPPDIVVDPASISESTHTGLAVTVPVTIANRGGSDLEWKARVRRRPGTAAISAQGSGDLSGRLEPDESAWLLPLEGRRDAVATASQDGFGEDFEDGDFAGWLEKAPASREITSATAADGSTYSYHESASIGGHYTGISHDLPSVRPRQVSFWVRASSTFTDTSYVVIRSPDGADILWFYAKDSGRFYVNADVNGDESFAYQPNRWYNVEFRNIDFDAATFEYWVDGAPIDTSVSFRHPASAVSFDRIELYNYSYGGEAWWDEISVGDAPLSWARIAPREGVVPPAGSTPLTLTLDASELDGGDFAADVEIGSNDPDQAEIHVPVDLHVIASPDIDVQGARITALSTQPFRFYYETTGHDLALSSPAAGPAQVTVQVDGNFASAYQTATVAAEGVTLGTVGNTGSTCGTARRTFTLAADDFARMASDGVVHVDVTNGYGVVPWYCTLNQHSVELSYHAPADRLDFGQSFLGVPATLVFTIANTGRATLTVSSIASSDAAFTVPAGSVSVPKRSSVDVTAAFLPTEARLYDAWLTITSDDPDEGTVVVRLRGEGLVPPDIDVIPAALDVPLFTNQVATVPLTVANRGGSDLRFAVGLSLDATATVLASSGPLPAPAPPLAAKDEGSAAPVSPPAAWIHTMAVPAGASSAPGPEERSSLAEVLSSLNENFGLVNSAIPLRYDFVEGVSGYSIVDGGGDMYDDGNYLYFGSGSAVPYSDGQIATYPTLGPAGRYFTRKFPGLFVLAADLDGVSTFQIYGNLGADGYGSADGTVIDLATHGRQWRVFVKRVWGAGDPSVNHMVILEGAPDATQEFSTYTNDDYHAIRRLDGVRRLHYLLFASNGGSRVDDDAMTSIARAYVDALPADWLDASPKLGTVPAGGSAGVGVRIDATALDAGVYTAGLVVTSNDPDEPRVRVPVTLRVTGAPDIDVRGPAVTQNSTLSYTAWGASTAHAFAVPSDTSGPATVELVAEGDYQDSYRTASIAAEGVALGHVGNTSVSCGPARGTFALDAATLARLGSDGRVDVTVQNSYYVSPYCNINRHRVRFSYRLPADHYDFGDAFIGATPSTTLELANTGTDVLHVASLATDDAQFRVSPAALDLAPRGTATVTITFAPSRSGAVSGSLTISSDDPDEGTVAVQLSGRGLVPPAIRAAPSSFAASLLTGQVETQTLAIRNAGGSDLVWSASVRSSAASSSVLVSDPATTATVALPPPATSAPPPIPSPERLRREDAPASGGALGLPGLSAAESLETILRDLDAAAPDIAAGIPDRFDFHGGEFGTYIAGAADGMYVNGNFLGSWNEYPISYSDGAVTSTSAFGPGSRYFTRKYAGLFVLVADVTNSPSFSISGNLGAGGFGSVDGAVLTAVVDGVQYLGFVKRVYGGSTPSVNHLVIVEASQNSAYQYYSSWAGDDYHQVFGIPRGSRLSYLLFATRDGGHVDDAAMLRIMTAYLEAPSHGWIRLGARSGVVPPGGVADVPVTLDAGHRGTQDLLATIVVNSNDPVTPTVETPLSLHIQGAPHVAILGRRRSASSAQDFYSIGAVTVHSFSVPDPPSGDATLDLVADGDFDQPYEYATVFLEGGPSVGQTEATGSSCSPAMARITLPHGVLAGSAADGVVSVTVHNTYDVDPNCFVNRHALTLTWYDGADGVTFDPMFIGRHATATITLENTGVDDLDVTALRSSDPDLSASGAPFTLAPGAQHDVSIAFAPARAGAIDAVLTIDSNDPSQPHLGYPVSGVGVIPPHLVVAPASIDATLLSGEREDHPLTIRNTGGSDLEFTIATQPSGDAAGAAAERPAQRPPPAGETDAHDPLRAPSSRSDLAPAGWSSFETVPSTVAGATVLVLADNPYPWGSPAVFRTLDDLRLGYDIANSATLPAIDFHRYSLIIVPSDQPTGFYLALRNQAIRIDDFVRRGGSLEFHAAGWGFNGGDPSLLQLPGGVTISKRLSYRNFVTASDHPITRSMPSLFNDAFASHAIFAGGPGDLETLITDEFEESTFVVYRVGSGIVMAAGQTIERGWLTGLAQGNLLIPMVEFGTGTHRHWLEPGKVDRTVLPPGESFVIPAAIDAVDLSASDYLGSFTIDDNDPARPTVVVPVSASVRNLIAEAGGEQVLECTGGSAADALLDGSASRHASDPSLITAFLWSAAGEPLGDGALLVSPMPLGRTGVDLTIEDAAGDTSSDATAVTVVDTTSPSGSITFPPEHACLGPAALPVVVRDDAHDVCSADLVRSYSEPGGPSYASHGDHSVALTVGDPSGNVGSGGAVNFTIDTVPPTLTILPTPSQWVFPAFIPFRQFFSDGDADGAAGGVVHETIAVDGCTVFDGLTYGNGDGLLLDEGATPGEDTMCRLVRLCQRRQWVDPVITTTATDCGGNAKRVTFTKLGSYAPLPGHCP